MHDGGLPPMSDSFDLEQSSWTFKAFPALVLFNTQLPLLDKNALKVNLAAVPKPTHDAAWWGARTNTFNFKEEDQVPTEQFNRIIWAGLMGDKPYPTLRSGLDLRQNRAALLKSITSEPSMTEAHAGSGSKCSELQKTL